MKIDLILQGNFGVIPIEIKYSSYTPLKQLNNMQQFMADLEKKSHLHIPVGMVINQSKEARWLTDKILQIPATWL